MYINTLCRKKNTMDVGAVMERMGRLSDGKNTVSPAEQTVVSFSLWLRWSHHPNQVCKNVSRSG